MKGDETVIPTDEIESIIDDILALKEPDTNTPFFGNSGAKIPMKEVKSADQVLAKWEGHEGLSLNDDRVRTGRMRVIAAMIEYANQFK